MFMNSFAYRLRTYKWNQTKTQTTITTVHSRQEQKKKSLVAVVPAWLGIKKIVKKEQKKHFVYNIVLTMYNPVILL